LFAGALVALVYFFLVKPLRRRVTDEQVALYLEEKEPTLQTMLVSAVGVEPRGRHWESTALVRKLIEQAIERCCHADTARRAEHGPLRTNGAVFAGSSSPRCCSCCSVPHSSGTPCPQCCSCSAAWKLPRRTRLP
jgi:hypothetical protein